MKISDSYSTPLCLGLFFTAAFMLLVVATYGAILHAVCLSAVAAYLVIAFTITLRRPMAPTKVDLLVVAYGLPVIWLLAGAAFRLVEQWEGVAYVD